MNINLPTRLRQLLASASGLGEPIFDAEMRITNWPENFTNEVRHLTGELNSSGNQVELRTCADVLNTIQSLDAPEGLLQMLSRAVFDNPNTPLREI